MSLAVFNLLGEIKLENTASSKIFKDPQGRTLVVHSPDGSLPSEQELDQMFIAKYGSEQNKPTQTDGGISVGFSDAIREFGNTIKNPSIESQISGPIIGPASAMAQNFYEKQRNDINNILPQRLKTNIGAGIRETLPLTKLIPKDVVSNSQIGNAVAPFIIDATALSATPGEGKLIKSGAEGIASSFEANSAKKLGKAKDILQRILRPGENLTPEMLDETVPFVKKSKKLRDLLDTLRSERYRAGEEKSALIKNIGDKTNERPVFSRAIDFINKKRAEGILPDEKFTPLEEALRKEIDIVNSYPKEQLTPEFFDKRKMAFQDYAEKLYGKDPSPDSQLVKQLWKDIASDYRGIVEGFDPRVSKANRRVSGLIQSTDLLDKRAKQEIDSSTQYDKSTPKKVFETIISRVPGVDQILYGRRRFESLMNEPKMDIPFMTGKIEKNYKSSKRSNDIASFIRGVVNDFGGGIKKQPQKLLPAPEPKQISADRMSLVGRRLQDMSSKPTINIPESGRSPIEIPQVLESEKEALMQKYGIPERNIRESISASNIPPVITSSKLNTGDRGLNKSQRSFIREAIERRKKNFGGK